MATHLDQVHGVHLFCDRVLPFITGVEEIGIKITEKKRLASPRAFQPGLMDLC
jgi:hypothetical protein